MKVIWLERFSLTRLVLPQNTVALGLPHLLPLPRRLVLSMGGVYPLNGVLQVGLHYGLVRISVEQSIRRRVKQKAHIAVSSLPLLLPHRRVPTRWCGVLLQKVTPVRLETGA